MIERMYAKDIAKDALVLDFTYAPSQVLNDANPFGYAYHETLHHLDIASHQVSEQSIILSGQPEQVRACADDLEQHIGSIARCGAERARFKRRDIVAAIAGITSRLTEEVIPDITRRDTFYLLATAITWPFAIAANNSGNDLFLLHGEAWNARDNSDYFAKRQSAIDTFLSERQRR